MTSRHVTFRLGLAAGLLAVAGCQKTNEFQPPPPPEVTVALPVQKDVVERIELTGTTRATATVPLRSRVDGYLKQIAFKDGDNVVEGQPLFVIDPAPYKVALQSAEAQQQKARAALALAEANLGRTRQLYQQKATTDQQLDLQKAEYASAEAEVATANAAFEQADLNLGYTEIRAPLTGRIGRHLVDVGSLVQSETTPLATIEAVNPIHAYFYLSEPELLRFMKMLRQEELPDPGKNPPVLWIGLANETGYPHKGHLDYRELGIDSATGTTLRRAVFDNPDQSIVPGMFVRLMGEIGKPEPRLLVEERAIGSDQRGDYLLVVNSQNDVEYRPVQLGALETGLRVVVSGIGPNDRIIVNGLQRARPGAKVNPKTEAQIKAAEAAAAAQAAKEKAGPAAGGAPATPAKSPAAVAPQKSGAKDAKSAPDPFAPDKKSPDANESPVTSPQPGKPESASAPAPMPPKTDTSPDSGT